VTPSTARRIATTLAAGAALLTFSVPAARADLKPWDQGRVTSLAERLADSSNVLYDTFLKQPVPGTGSLQARSYTRLKDRIRRIRQEARQLAGGVRKGEGREQTLNSYQDLMQQVRSAREDAQKVFTGSDVADKAADARAVLNELGPYYDPSFQALEPPKR
jgi:hypothetical protein